MELRIRYFRARVAHLLCRTPHARVAHTLLTLAAERSVMDADGVLIPLRLSQLELAALAGLTRETVNIVLRDLRGRGLVPLLGDAVRRPERHLPARATPRAARPARLRCVAQSRRRPVVERGAAMSI
ncbi:MAG: Crp/Fnr family transcriptional regulator [Acidobacteria bacterium]|nr:Crp/Fnr family transcriptional regulator [Acidobacteriota bacterium]